MWVTAVVCSGTTAVWTNKCRNRGRLSLPGNIALLIGFLKQSELSLKEEKINNENVIYLSVLQTLVFFV